MRGRHKRKKVPKPTNFDRSDRANRAGFSCSLPVRTRGSEDQRPGGVVAALGPKMLDPIVIVIPEIVKSQAVPLWVYHITQLCLEQAVLSGVQGTLKHGVLHSLAVVHALPCQPAQAALSGSVLSVDIVGNDDKHIGLTSTETADSRPDRPGGIGPATVPVHRGPGPRAAFLSKMGG